MPAVMPQRYTRDKQYFWAWQRGDTGLFSFAERSVLIRLGQRDGAYGRLRPSDMIALAHRRVLWARSRLHCAQTLSYWRGNYVAAGADDAVNLRWWSDLCQNS